MMRTEMQVFLNDNLLLLTDLDLPEKQKELLLMEAFSRYEKLTSQSPALNYEDFKNLVLGEVKLNKTFNIFAFTKGKLGINP